MKFQRAFNLKHAPKRSRKQRRAGTNYTKPKRKMSVQITISNGELSDRVTILRLKQKFAVSPEAAETARVQLAALEPKLKALTDGDMKVLMLVDELADTNWHLWNEEDLIRRAIIRGMTVESYATNIVIANDRRSKLKREIDANTGLELGDVKTYNGKTL